jgi:cysteinyl-tRNA synthetase
MSLKLFNTLSKSKEVFNPTNVNDIKIYACGPTLYNNPHIGNFRPIIIFDVLYRFLRHHYGINNVTYVRNITDIDDKIINRSLELAISTEDLVKSVKEIYHDNLSKLQILPPSYEPHATEYIPKMIEMIEDLVKNNFAYVSDNHVLFESKKYQNYGELSKLSLKDIISGARVEVANYKKNPEDFVLWKPSKDDEPSWASPWGEGRPGWHIECSAMIAELLGPTIDIHAGGLDLIFPHHENEIAQSSCYHNAKMANYWLHNGFINFKGEKMSKSIGNITIIDDLLKKVNPMVIKYSLLSTHYRQPIDFSDDLLNYSENIISKWRDFICEPTEIVYDEEFINSLNDDLNTPMALMRIQQIYAKIKKDPKNKGLLNTFNCCLDLIGLVPSFKKNELDLDNEFIENIITRRNEAKKLKNFELADQLRADLLDKGILLEDTKDGTIWKKI